LKAKGHSNENKQTNFQVKQFFEHVMISGNTKLRRLQRSSDDNNSYSTKCHKVNLCTCLGSVSAASWQRYGQHQTAAPGEQIEDQSEKEEKKKKVLPTEEAEEAATETYFDGAVPIAVTCSDNWALLDTFVSTEFNSMPAKQYPNLLPIGVGWRVKPDPGD
jgi:hypothetical protein